MRQYIILKTNRLAGMIIQRTVILTLMIFGSCAYYRGPESGHFTGGRFFNAQDDSHTFWETLKWLWEMKTVEWPDYIADSLPAPPPKRVYGGGLSATYINHSTVLIQTCGVNILTDPIWSDYAGPISWLGVKRVRQPGVEFDSLPPIDIILISHDHYDHLDIPTIERLCLRDKPLIICGLGVSKRLTLVSTTRVEELDWMQDFEYANNIAITFLPAHHRSGRGLFDNGRTLWGSFAIRTPHGNILFIGDSAFDSLMTESALKYSPYRLSIIPVGSYEKRWFMRNQHMNPAEAVTLHKLMRSTHSIGVHYGTFREHPEQSITAHETDTKAAIDSLRVSASEFILLRFGESSDF